MLESVTIAMEFDNVETVKRAIEINAGIAILLASTVVTESERKQLVTYKPKVVCTTVPFAIIHKKNRLLTPALDHLLNPMEQISHQKWINSPFLQPSRFQ